MHEVLETSNQVHQERDLTYEITHTTHSIMGFNDDGILDFL